MTERFDTHVGDVTDVGGVVLTGLEHDTWYGKALSYEGDKIACPICRTMGSIQCVGTRISSTGSHGKQAALDGDLCICRCSPPPRLVASQNSCTTAGDANVAGLATCLVTGKLLSTFEPHAYAVSDKLTPPVSAKELQDISGQPPLRDDPELICPNMSNAEFAQLSIRLRDDAIKLVDLRLVELQRWSAADKERVIDWFGVATDETVARLRTGFQAMRKVLSGLKAGNFVRYSEAAFKNVGCVVGSASGGGAVAAAVCKPDTKTHAIGINLSFCQLPYNKTMHGTDTIMDGDSKLLTLLHEVSHYDDTFGSFDHWYTTKWSRMKASTKDALCLSNAENIAGYVLGIAK